MVRTIVFVWTAMLILRPSSFADEGGQNFNLSFKDFLADTVYLNGGEGASQDILDAPTFDCQPLASGGQTTAGAFHYAGGNGEATAQYAIRLSSPCSDFKTNAVDILIVKTHASDCKNAHKVHTGWTYDTWFGTLGFNTCVLWNLKTNGVDLGMDKVMSYGIPTITLTARPTATKAKKASKKTSKKK